MAHFGHATLHILALKHGYSHIGCIDGSLVAARDNRYLVKALPSPRMYGSIHTLTNPLPRVDWRHR